MTTKFKNCAQRGRKEGKYGIYMGVSPMAHQIKNHTHTHTYIYGCCSVVSDSLRPHRL